MLPINQIGATCPVKWASSGSAHVSTRLAIGLLTHGSILICSPKNRSRLVDTFFRNPCILVPDTETQSSVNGVAQGYISERESGLGHSLESALVFTRLKRRAKVSGKGAPQRPRWLLLTLGGKPVQIGRSPWTTNFREVEPTSTRSAGRPALNGLHMWQFDSKGSTLVDDNCAVSYYLCEPDERNHAPKQPSRLTSARFPSCIVYLWSLFTLPWFGLSLGASSI